MSKKSEDPLVGEVIKSKAHDFKKLLKRAGWLAIAESVILGILGVILIVWTNSAITVAAWIVGLALIALGVYKLIDYFAIRGVYDFSNNGLLTGVISLLAGITVIVFKDSIDTFFGVIIGIWIVYAALVRMNTAIKMKAAKMSAWAYSLLVSALMLIVGIFVIFNGAAEITVQFIGWSMLIAAILGIIDDVIYLYRIDTFSDAVKHFFEK